MKGEPQSKPRPAKKTREASKLKEAADDRPMDISRVCRVAVSRRGVVRDMLLHPDMPVEDLHACLRAIFPDVGTPIALKNETDTLFPLSLLAHHPGAFSAARKVHAHAHVHASSLELVCLGDPDASYAELTRSLRVGWHDEAPALDLSEYTLSQLIDTFRAAAPTGGLDRSSFIKCLTQLCHRSDHNVFSRFFDLFDKDRNGVVDVVEFVSGLSVLVHGDRDEKIQATFTLYDTNGDGYISLEEMTTYLTSVYLVVAELNPAVFLSNRVDPIQLGQVTAQQCFDEADLDHDGRLSFHEFQQWYARTNQQAPQHARALKMLNQKQTQEHASQPIQVKWTLEAVRDMTGLGDYTVEEMLAQFPRTRSLSETDFVAMMTRILQRQRKPVSVEIASLLKRLYTLFADPNELRTGLSILCAPDVDAVFGLVDTNGDGQISMNEMTAYFRAVFRVLHGVTNVHVPLAPDVLAMCTAQQMFHDFDMNRDGILSRLEFQAWYATPTAALPKPAPLFPNHAAVGSIHVAPATMTLERVGKLTNLWTRHPADVFEILALYVNGDGVLDRKAFYHAFERLMQGGSAEAETPQVIARLFSAFDSDGNGVVDFCELSSGLSLLCAGSQSEKVEAAFALYDVNKDGFIAYHEMVSYLTAVFRVLAAFASTPLPLAPEKLAEVTAHDAFVQYDANRDGQLSYDEFTSWYSTPVPSAPPAPLTPDLSLLRDVRELTCLGQYAVDDIFAFFTASAKENGVLTKAQFFRCFNKLLSKTTTTAPKASIKATLDRLFVLFDADGNGSVDTKELAAGLSLLCGGSAKEKVTAAFSLFDTNGDGFISPSEMETYLTAAFKILFETAPHLPQQLGTDSPIAVAKATTAQCFASCDTNRDGKLSLDEFSVWYQNPSAARTSRPLSIPDAQATLGMQGMSTRQLIAALGNAARKPVTSAGILSVLGLHGARAAPAKELLEGLLASLTASVAVRVTWPDVVAGLSVLAHDASQDDKVQAVFALIDRNGDGRLSQAELARYFTAVFSVMYVLEPQKQSTLGGVGPVALAEATAATTMAEADTDRDGAISFPEFQRWYAPGPTTLADFRRVTRLGGLDVDDVFETFADYADDAGLISFERFHDGLVSLAGRHPDPSLSTVASRLFCAFDQDQNERVDFSELASGLSVLCKGSRDLKVKAAFSLYDYNGDGYISMDEMVRYLTSVFRVLYEVSPGMATETGVSAAELGTATAKQAFVEADTNHDGKLSLEEFTEWYKQPLHVSAEEMAVATGKRLTLEQLQHATNLVHFSAEEVFELFAEAANEDGNLTKDAFNQCFATLIPNAPADIRGFLNRLYALFEHDGVVDFSALSSGLSVLCGGSKEDKVRAAFALFDFNGDGFISQDEMTRYLHSVFQVLYEVGAHTVKDVTPLELATVTAEQAFDEADLNHDGKISLDEFKKWYQQSNADESRATLFSLQEARRLTQLERFPAEHVFEVLAEAADANGNLTKDAFVQCFESHFVVGPIVGRVHDVLSRLFGIFDADKNGVVDFGEITAGLTLLCGGARKEKIQAAFALYDYNHDGYISLLEMTRYLSAVFRVLYETDPTLAEKMQVTADELAQVTAEQAFLDADRNHDGKLSLDEFETWYTQSNGLPNIKPNKISLPSLAQVRHLTNLHAFPPSQVVECFRRAAHDATGQLTLQDFTSVLQSFATGDAASVDAVATRLFAIFDTDGNGVVDFNELGAGLSVLCGGTQEDKVRAAFALYDANHDGTISKAEMALYLTSVFKVLYESSPETQARLAGVSPDELGEVTADQAFEEADLNHDGSLSFDEFRKWYLTPSASGLNHVEMPSWVSLASVRELTQLHKYAPQDVFNVIAQYANDTKQLDRAAFEASFAALIPLQSMDKEARHRVHLILDRLFEIFDTDQNGLVDFLELSSGLSVLCGGRKEDRVKAAFDLYDLNHDGVVSLDEMTTYLTSVFKVLFETNPGQQPPDATPLEVVFRCDTIITAEQCFEEADLNHDGKLSLDEFVSWYSKTNATLSDAGSAVAMAGSDDEAPSGSTSTSAGGMERIRSLLKLDMYEVADIFEIFAEAAPSGELNFASFRQCFEHMVELAGGYPSPQAKQEASVVIRRLFRAFDRDENNAVDFGELASGLSVLSGSSMDDKVLAAFRLYDINGDGFISLDEMVSYMTSIFKVMYETSDRAKDKMGVSPEELARATATQCFRDADVNHDARLSFDEFKQWCTASM
ncbi:hypothetical protein SPRG_10981 [Saprolegnia parasitica CBS 223.65]|uniref:EF-hand domain-containing protein n=1 Tax=Saprolegnia parasitica (strain CBS 223.65) TaxID=695850 RepID=A0A067C827_SAPPC|nr:hypothetical protein SPRG_10981 [Saprolegnia parasitica CBS 223.65]KDO22666.1 hypothetical protein SPRG_10981 [Saprolegnia parasitica CBS 223.65]|eukprot:XP_012206583.1 hypothetical protein SPRG_10981 [Saprolegnia parasitica CBS 223.65]